MSEETNKVALLSGKMTGTRTLKTELEGIESPDAIEQFLLELIQWKLPWNRREEVVVNDIKEFSGNLKKIEKSDCISIGMDPYFETLYITVDTTQTYVMKMEEKNSSFLAKLLVKDSLVKFSFASYTLLKWCIEQKVEVKNLYDIPTCLKILTNEVDPYWKIKDYMAQYTDWQEEEYTSQGESYFTYGMGKYLYEQMKKLQVDSICKMICDNSYEELKENRKQGNCGIQFGYSNLKQGIDTILEEKLASFQEKKYVRSPLGRIAIKYGHNEKRLLEELYAEDITVLILNELYNNNMDAQVKEDGSFIVHCKYKNLNHVFSLLNAILNDVFYRTLNQSFEATIRCEIKE